jgi:Kef-type K+ transport system membrane component KefB
MNTYQEVILADGTVVKEKPPKYGTVFKVSRKLLKYSTLVFIIVTIASASGVPTHITENVNALAVLGMITGLVSTFIFYGKYKKAQEEEQ